MKRFFCFPLLFSAALLLTHCSKPGKSDEPGPGNPGGPGGQQTGAIRPKGNPDGTVSGKKIGAAGGTLEYPGARLTVIVPAGAVDKETDFSIQPITNTAPGGKGHAYRLLPEGQTFKKPVTLKIRYTDEDLQSTIPAALGIATQKASGIWYASGVRQNETDKTIAVQTTHFSDWSFFEAISLEPSMTVADPGQQISMAVKYVLPGEDDFLVPLTAEGKEAALLDPKNLLDSKFIKEWKLTGGGQITASGNTGKYTAPVKIPATNPVTVSVHITSKGKAAGILISRVFVAPEGISVSIGGGDYTTYGNAGGHVTGGESFASSTQDGVTASVKWQGSMPGQWNWDAKKVLFLLNIGTSKTYSQVYQSGGKAIPSPGKLTILDIGGNGKWMLGTFELQKAGSFVMATPPVISTTNIKGYVRVKRLN